jgi:hypothetical protein
VISFSTGVIDIGMRMMVVTNAINAGSNVIGLWFDDETAVTTFASFTTWEIVVFMGWSFPDQRYALIVKNAGVVSSVLGPAGQHGSFRRLRMTVNGGTNIEFYVDDVLQGTWTGTISFAFGGRQRFAMATATSGLATTAQVVAVDYIYYKYTSNDGSR